MINGIVLILKPLASSCCLLDLISGLSIDLVIDVFSPNIFGEGAGVLSVAIALDLTVGLGWEEGLGAGVGDVTVVVVGIGVGVGELIAVGVVALLGAGVAEALLIDGENILLTQPFPDRAMIDWAVVVELEVNVLVE